MGGYELEQGWLARQRAARRPTDAAERKNWEVATFSPEPTDAGQLSTEDYREAAFRTMRQALEDCVDPMAYLQRKADDQGAVLNGFAKKVAKDPETTKRIARDALSVVAVLLAGTPKGGSR